MSICDKVMVFRDGEVKAFDAANSILSKAA